MILSLSEGAQRTVEIFFQSGGSRRCAAAHLAEDFRRNRDRHTWSVCDDGFGMAVFFKRTVLSEMVSGLHRNSSIPLDGGCGPADQEEGGASGLAPPRHPISRADLEQGGCIKNLIDIGSAHATKECTATGCGFAQFGFQIKA